MISTTTYTTTAAAYIRVAAAIWWGRWWWTLTLPFMAACIMAAVVDVRWVLVALMLLFLVLPIVLVDIYFYYLLTAHARRMILPKRLDIGDDGSITLTYTKPEITNPEEGGDIVDTPAPEHIAADEILRWRVDSRYFIVVLRGREPRFILIPFTAMSADDYQTLDRKYVIHTID